MSGKTVAQIKQELDEKGVKYDDSALKKDLLALLSTGNVVTGVQRYIDRQAELEGEIVNGNINADGLEIGKPVSNEDLRRVLAANKK